MGHYDNARERPTEYVHDGHKYRWQHPTHNSTPIGLITYSEMDGPELPAGWVYWALGKVGSADSYDDAKSKIEQIVARQTKPSPTTAQSGRNF